VLLYYSITNLAALQLSDEERMFSPAWAWVGLSACLALAFSIELQVWMAGGAVLLGGLALRWLMGFSPRPGTNG
jgi:basic amino acid/polyamine antiporter, APA family